jgi:hypothetical protein
MTKIMEKFNLDIKNDWRVLSMHSLIAKYVFPLIILWNFIGILQLSYENSFDFKDFKKVEGSLKTYEEKRDADIFSMIIKRWVSFELRVYLEGNFNYYTMYDNPNWYLFLYSLKPGDKLIIYYLPEYDFRIKELVVNNVTKYSFKQEQNLLKKRINKGCKS